MIKITTADGLIHTLDSVDKIPSYTSSINTRLALKVAYDAGHFEAFNPPDVAPQPNPPDWPAFRLALMQATSFRSWSETLPATWREDLKLAAIAANSEALQTVYTLLANQYPPATAATAEWQSIADANHIPVVFYAET